MKVPSSVSTSVHILKETDIPAFNHNKTLSFRREGNYQHVQVVLKQLQHSRLLCAYFWSAWKTPLIASSQLDKYAIVGKPKNTLGIVPSSNGAAIDITNFW